jgi:flagellin-like hook-associated protein FlgL
MITISNNGAAQRASYHLGKAQDNFQISIRRLASGKRLLGPNDDPGTLAVTMKVKASINRLTGAQNNIKNAMGFLEVQDGLLETAGKIVMRMSELKGYATQDPLKSESDIASYNNEFKDLQYQLFQISEMDFNGTSLFANYAADSSTGSASTTEAKFGGKDQDPLKDFTLDIFTSSEGSEGTKVSIHKSLLLSALTLRQTDEDFTAEDGEAGSGSNSGYWSKAENEFQHPTGKRLNTTTGKATDGTFATQSKVYLTLAVDPNGENKALDLSQVSAGVLERAIENVVFLRAQTGGGMSRLSFAQESIQSQETNMRSALGRLEDVDIAAESARLAKFGVMMQAAAAMAVQANLTNEVALMLLR